MAKALHSPAQNYLNYLFGHDYDRMMTDLSDFLFGNPGNRILIVRCGRSTGKCTFTRIIKNGLPDRVRDNFCAKQTAINIVSVDTYDRLERYVKTFHDLPIDAKPIVILMANFDNKLSELVKCRIDGFLDFKNPFKNEHRGFVDHAQDIIKIIREYESY